MASGDQKIQALRDALKVSPDNLPLKQHLAESLLSVGRPEEAEQVQAQKGQQSLVVEADGGKGRRPSPGGGIAPGGRAASGSPRRRHAETGLLIEDLCHEISA